MSPTALWIALLAVAVPVALSGHRLLFVLDLNVQLYSAALVEALAKPDPDRFLSLLAATSRSLPSQLARHAWGVRQQLPSAIPSLRDVGYREPAPAPDYRPALRKLLAPDIDRLHRRLLIAWLPTTIGVLAPAMAAFAQPGLGQTLAAFAILALTLQCARRVRALWQGMDAMLDELAPLLGSPRV